MLQALRHFFAPELTALERRVAALEHNELQREMETADLKDYLSRFAKRLRQRERRDGGAGGELDPITRAILERRGALQHDQEE